MTGAEAVAEVIKACGYDAVAVEYVADPHKRTRIRRGIEKIILRDHGVEKASRFVKLAEASREA